MAALRALTGQILWQEKGQDEYKEIVADLSTVRLLPLIGALEATLAGGDGVVLFQ